MDSRRNRVGAIAASIALLVVALVGASLLPVRVAAPIVVSTGGPVQTLATSGINFDYVMIILMENHNICDIYTHCGGTGTYMTALADAYSIARQDNYCNVNPSLPNYLCLSGARTSDVRDTTAARTRTPARTAHGTRPTSSIGSSGPG